MSEPVKQTVGHSARLSIRRRAGTTSEVEAFKLHLRTRVTFVEHESHAGDLRHIGLRIPARFDQTGWLETRWKPGHFQAIEGNRALEWRRLQAFDRQRILLVGNEPVSGSILQQKPHGFFIKWSTAGILPLLGVAVRAGIFPQPVAHQNAAGVRKIQHAIEFESRPRARLRALEEIFLTAKGCLFIPRGAVAKGQAVRQAMPRDGALEFRLVSGRQDGEVAQHTGAFSGADRLHQNPRTLFHERFPGRIEGFSYDDRGVLETHTRTAEQLLDWLANHGDLLSGEIGLLEMRENLRLADLAVSRRTPVRKLTHQSNRRDGFDAG